MNWNLVRSVAEEKSLFAQCMGILLGVLTSGRTNIFSAEIVLHVPAITVRGQKQSKRGTGGLAMAECIDRAAALEITTRTCGDYAAAWSEIRRLPAVDAVVVTRCKDCAYWKKTDQKQGPSVEHMEYIGSCVISRFYKKENDFCSDGEPKDEYHADDHD